MAAFTGLRVTEQTIKPTTRCRCAETSSGCRLIGDSDHRDQHTPEFFAPEMEPLCFVLFFHTPVPPFLLGLHAVEGRRRATHWLGHTGKEGGCLLNYSRRQNLCRDGSMKVPETVGRHLYTEGSWKIRTLVLKGRLGFLQQNPPGTRMDQGTLHKTPVNSGRRPRTTAYQALLLLHCQTNI